MPTTPNKIPEYLSFTRKERTGITAIVLLILFFIILPFLFPFFIKTKTVNHTAFEKEIAALNMNLQDSGTYYANRNVEGNNYQTDNPASEKRYYSKQPQGERFYFDPNTLSAAGWIKLGIREKTANTILKYTAKGGRFNKPEDIAKIWGLHTDEVNSLLPYVRIAAKTNESQDRSISPVPYQGYKKNTYSIPAVDINNADTAAFIALPGIGRKLANRIIHFRNKLGGFYKIEQVAETFGLPDSTFQKIKDKLIITNKQVKKLNINLATEAELKMHPYLSYTIANAVVAYRNQHGKYTALTDLKKILIISEDIFNKVVVYLTVN